MNIQITTTPEEDNLIAELQKESVNTDKPEVFVEARWHAQQSGEIEARNRAEKNIEAQLRQLPQARAKKVADTIAAEIDAAIAEVAPAVIVKP